MAIYLPQTAEEESIGLDELTPREIVGELDKHVVGQQAAKRAVAIAIRAQDILRHFCRGLIFSMIQKILYELVVKGI